MAITTYDGLVAALGSGAQDVDFTKANVSFTTGRFMSMFRTTGRPSAAAAPSTAAGAALTSATLGAIPFVNPPAGVSTYLAQWAITATTAPASIILYDRWVETGALSGIVTTAQTVASAGLPSRAGTGQGGQLWLEVYTSLGSTAVGTVTASYTNQAGVTGRTATLIGGIPGTAVANTMIPFALQAGDTGVQAVASVTVAASTGTAGAFGIVILSRIGEIGAMANMSNTLSFADLGMPIIPDSACLAMMSLNNGNLSPLVTGALTLVQG